MRTIGARARLLLALSLGMGAALALAPAAQANKIAERTRQKEVAEDEREALQKKLGQLKSDITQTEAAKSDAVDTLKESEAAISDANRKLRDLGQQQAQTQSRLTSLAQREQALAQTVAVQKAQLEKLLREQYMVGEQSHIKLLLSGDNPNRISRDMQYLGYISQSQAQLIATLRANLASVEANKKDTQNAQQELDGIASQQRNEKTALEQEKTKRAQLLAALSSKLVQQHKQVDTLERNQKRLSDLVDKLAAQIEAQKKAEAEAAKRRAERLAREKAERERREQASKPGSIRKHQESPPEPRGVENEQLPDAAVQDGVFASLRGRLRLPVKGAIVSRYGSAQSLGPSNKGLFIKAPEGEEVHAIAPGRVVFAEWMRGFGNLIIIDHGSQYLSIYGNNETIYKRAGDAIKAGDVIATVGSSGGSAQTGLYFELRHHGAPFDPMGWVSLK